MAIAKFGRSGEPVTTLSKPTVYGGLDIMALLATLFAYLASTLAEAEVSRPNELRTGQDGITALVFSPTDPILVAAGEHGRVLIWDTAKWQKRRTIKAGPGPVYALAFSRDGHFLATGSFSDATAKVWDTKTWREMGSFSLGRKGGKITSVDFSPDGKTLVFDDWKFDAKVIVCDWRKKTKLLTLTGHEYGLKLSFAPDGKTIATVGDEELVNLWDAKSGKLLHSFKAHRHPQRLLEGIDCLAFSPDSKILATGGVDAKVRLWSVESGKAVAVLAGLHGPVRKVAFSPDGKLIAASEGAAEGRRMLLAIWDVASRRALTVMPIRGGASCLAFTRDGKILATSNYEEHAVVKLWDVQQLISDKQ